MKLTENNIPSHLRAHIVYLFEGRTSKNQLKKLGKTNTEYVTICRLVDSDGNVVSEGVAACSLCDNPSRKIGRAIAIGRALAAYGVQRA